jgi:uncharacterized protein YqgQ
LKKKDKENHKLSKEVILYGLGLCELLLNKKFLTKEEYIKAKKIIIEKSNEKSERT